MHTTPHAAFQSASERLSLTPSVDPILAGFGHTSHSSIDHTNGGMDGFKVMVVCRLGVNQHTQGAGNNPSMLISLLNAKSLAEAGANICAALQACIRVEKAQHK